MKTIQKMMMITATGLFLASCGGSAEETPKEPETGGEETKSESVSTTYSIDTENSTINWKGSMLGMYDHSGTLSVKSGSVTITDGQITAGEIVVDMTSITPTDENYDEDKTPEKLVGHLSSADFFDVENNPTASLSILSVDGESGTANLTIRGKTDEEVIAPIRFEELDGTMNAKGELTFDRTKYDVSWEHPVKENVVSDDIELNFQLTGTAK